MNRMKTTALFCSLFWAVFFSSTSAQRCMMDNSWKKSINVECSNFTGVINSTSFENYEKHYKYNNERIFALTFSSTSITDIYELGDKFARAGLILLRSSKIKTVHPYAFQHFGEMKTLDLAKNQIDDIREHAFDGLRALMFLDLTDNRVAQLDNGTFEHLENLRYLGLKKNLISSLDRSMFASLRRLVLLELSNNKLENIPAGVFTDLIGLLTLELNGNSIKHLHVGSFTGLKKLTTLDIGDCQLEELDSSTLYPLTRLKILHLSDNRLTQFDVNQTFDNFPDLKIISMAGNIWDCEWLASSYPLLGPKLRESEIGREGVTFIPNSKIACKELQSSKEEEPLRSGDKDVEPVE